jgi:hypothetical protein
MVDERAVTLCRAPLAVAKIGTVMTARSYVQGDHVRSPTELMSECALFGCVMTRSAFALRSEQRGWRCFNRVEDLYESFNSRSRDFSWHRIVCCVRFLCRTGKRRGYRDRSLS